MPSWAIEAQCAGWQVGLVKPNEVCSARAAAPAVPHYVGANHERRYMWSPVSDMIRATGIQTVALATLP